jgi:hypothetical protein
MAANVQRFATRRQAQVAIGQVPLDFINSDTRLHALGAVYSGAREARGGANRIVNCRSGIRGRPTTLPRS